MSEEMKAGLTIAEKAQMQSDITSLKAQLAEAQKQADANKDGHVDQISLTKADWESTQSKLAILEQQLAQLTSNFNQFINMVIPDANLPILEEEKPDGVMKQ